MNAAISHRGPDDCGDAVELPVRLAIGHRRLSIHDLSPLGHQPMASATGRYLIAFNGEIYNYQQIRAELVPLGHSFRGDSDTEVLLAAVEQWGLQGTLPRCIGMFAIALWDRTQQELHLVRDRMGEKPLYWGWQQGHLLFGSELRALEQHPFFAREINRDALALLLKHNYIPAPWSIYRNVEKLFPGEVVTVQLGRLSRGELRTPQEATERRRYWSVQERVAAVAGSFSGSATEAVDELERLLLEAVGQQMQSDVPLGAFLSGGVDSSLIVALMQAQSSQKVRTFTIGFDVRKFDESQHAKAVATHLGTDHTEFRVTGEDALAVVPQLARIYDEPFSDSSQIPTYLVMGLAKQKVTVCLSGDGGDELFQGYRRYADYVKYLGIPPVAKAMGRGILKVFPPQSDRLLTALSGGVLRRSRLDRMRQLIQANPGNVYSSLVSQWNRSTEVVPGSRTVLTSLTDPAQQIHAANPVDMMGFLDLISYLPNDILSKVDRAAMAHSLETRVPLLDHRVVEYSLSLPHGMKCREGKTKWPMRQVLYRYVPQELIERPKMGFGVPLALWLRSDLRDWAEELLAEERLHAQGYFDASAIRALWSDHLGGIDHSARLWSVLMFQEWLQRPAYESRGSGEVAHG
jgi:asparagine synthase (glutamine-hydrolysing)